jgi:hypothetical protein
VIVKLNLNNHDNIHRKYKSETEFICFFCDVILCLTNIFFVSLINSDRYLHAEF